MNEINKDIAIKLVTDIEAFLARTDEYKLESWPMYNGKGNAMFVTATNDKAVTDLGDIRNTLGEELITDEGQRNFAMENLMVHASKNSFQFQVGESDSFGPLSIIIHTPKGAICYG